MITQQNPDEVRSAKIAGVAVEMMNRWNQGKTNPSDMAVCGHDTSTGYEFFVERDGEIYNFTVTIDSPLKKVT